jgi:hypothetical protein
MINFSEKESQADTINLEDDKPIIVFGLHVEGAKDTVAPFYITLTIFYHLLHNCMLDSGASHNVMPKAIMDKLGLKVTRPYGDLYSFDSRRVKCIGMIKDLVVNLARIPSKSILMDVVVADIPPKYGMLLLGPHIVPFFPILFAITIPWITCIWNDTTISSDHYKVYNVLSHHYTFNLFCMIFYITLVLNH